MVAAFRQGCGGDRRDVADVDDTNVCIARRCEETMLRYDRLAAAPDNSDRAASRETQFGRLEQTQYTAPAAAAGRAYIALSSLV